MNEKCDCALCRDDHDWEKRIAETEPKTSLLPIGYMVDSNAIDIDKSFEYVLNEVGKNE